MKKLFGVLLALIIASAALINYLNRLLIPTKIKSAVTESIKRYTGKDVLLESLRFDIFKGLVFSGLTVYDEQRVLVYVKQGSCAFLFLPFARHNIIIPSLNLYNAELNLVKDSQGFSGLKGLSKGGSPGSGVLIYKIRLIDSRVIFNDQSLSPAFSGKLQKVNLVLNPSLPSKLRLSFSACLGDDFASQLAGSAEFFFKDDSLFARLQARNISLAEFAPYYQGSGCSVAGKLQEVGSTFSLANGILSAELRVYAKNLLIRKGSMQVLLNTDVSSALKYELKGSKPTVTGKALLQGCSISGIGSLGEMANITGRLDFNESRLSSERLRLDVWGMTVDPQLKIDNFQDPQMSLHFDLNTTTERILTILRDRLKLNLPLSSQGDCRLNIFVKNSFSSPAQAQFAGYLDLQGAVLKAQEFPVVLDSVKGRLNFDSSQVSWQELSFKYSDKVYKSAGSVKDYASPKVRLQVSGDDLYAETILHSTGAGVDILGLTGRYRGSKFSTFSDNSTLSLPDLKAEANLYLDIDCEDLAFLLPGLKSGIAAVRPKGLIHAKLTLMGRLDQYLSWEMYAKITSHYISLYGLKANDLSLLYTQKDGEAQVADMSLSFYDGILRSQAKVSLKEHFPYRVDLEAEGIKLEKLIRDTKADKKDVTGTLHGNIKLSGPGDELAATNGSGKIFITQGNLWQLNLFQGLGSLLFARDFANIAFTEGYCAFAVEDKSVFTDNLVLKSSIANLYGPVKLGFDGKIDGSLNIEVLDANAPVTGTFKDVTTALIGRAGRFGVLKISGNLKDAKYKFRPAVTDIIRGIKDAIIQ